MGNCAQKFVIELELSELCKSWSVRTLHFSSRVDGTLNQVWTELATRDGLNSQLGLSEPSPWDWTKFSTRINSQPELDLKVLSSEMDPVEIRLIR